MRGSRSNTPALYACTSSRMPRNAAASGVRDSARDGSRETRRRFARCSFCSLRSLGWRSAACMRIPLAHRVSPALDSISARSEAASLSSSARTVEPAGGPVVALVVFVTGGIAAGLRGAGSGAGGAMSVPAAGAGSAAWSYCRSGPDGSRRARDGAGRGASCSDSISAGGDGASPSSARASSWSRSASSTSLSSSPSRGTVMGRSFTFSPSAFSNWVRTSASPSIRQKISRTPIS